MFKVPKAAEPTTIKDESAADCGGTSEDTETAPEELQPEFDILTVPDRILSIFLDYVQCKVNERLHSLKHGDSGYSCPEIERDAVNTKKTVLSTSVLTAGLGLHFIGRVSVEHKPRSLKLGELYGLHLLFVVLIILSHAIPKSLLCHRQVYRVDLVSTIVLECRSSYLDGPSGRRQQRQGEPRMPLGNLN